MKKSLRLSVILLAIIVSISLIVSVKAAPGTSAASSVNFTRDVIYQIVTDRFVDGNTVNNPTGDLHDPTHANLRKYFGGDWQGIINKITDGYLPNMGVTAIWISPPVENIFAVLPDVCGSTSYHGFWVRDFKRTNPFFGELTCFQNLITTAHAHGIKVIIDFAPNHTSPSRSEDVNFAENGRFYNDGVFVGGVTNDIHGYFHHFGGTDFSTLEDGIYRNLFDLADFNHLIRPRRL